MFVEKAHAKTLVEKYERDFFDNKLNKLANTSLMDGYFDLLEKIASEYTYKEGEKIRDDDLLRITESVNYILAGMTNRMTDNDLRSSNALPTTDSCLTTLVKATDYLFALALNELGCPNIPDSFGPTVQNKIVSLAKPAEFESKKNAFEKTTTDVHFKNQRRKNADRVRSNNSMIMDFIGTKKATPLDIAKLAAEYQALKLRQEKHTRIWVFFHGKENELRTQLMEEMKESLRTALGSDFDVDGKTPREMAEHYNGQLIAKGADKAFEAGGIVNRCNIASVKKGLHLDAENVANAMEENDNNKEMDVNRLDNNERQSFPIDEREINGEQNREVVNPIHEDPAKHEPEITA